MKKITFAAFVAFWASVMTVAAMSWLSPEPAMRDDSALPEYTLKEVAEHDSLDSCWKVIEGKVYDFTDYIPDHPTPPSVMERWCGKESTEAMHTKGYGRDHSPAAWAMIDEYLIGRVAVDENR